jgi:hypothetical protein
MNYCVLGHKNPLCTAVKDVSLQPELQAQRFYVDKSLIHWPFAFPHFVIEADDTISTQKTTKNRARNSGFSS